MGGLPEIGGLLFVPHTPDIQLAKISQRVEDRISAISTINMFFILYPSSPKIHYKIWFFLNQNCQQNPLYSLNFGQKYPWNSSNDCICCQKIIKSRIISL